MERRVIQIIVTQMNLEKRGPSNSDNDANIFRFTLSHPIEGVPGLETVKSIGAREKIPTEWGDLSKAMVFKTAIRGKSALTVEAIAVDRKSRAAKFIRKVLRGVIGGFAGVWSKEFEDDYAGVVTKTAGTSLADLVDDSDSLWALGRGTEVIDSEDYAPAKSPAAADEAAEETDETGEAERKGEVAKEFCVALSIPKEAQYRNKRDVIELKKNEKNGFVKVRVESIGP